MRIQKALAACFCAGVLAAQVGTMGWWLRSKGHYWPFIDYPMYSHEHSPGDTLNFLHVRLVPCGPGVSSREVNASDLRLSYPIFNRLIEHVAAGKPDAATDLREVVEKAQPGNCTIQVWDKAYIVGKTGLEIPGLPLRRDVSVSVGGPHAPAGMGVRGRRS